MSLVWLVLLWITSMLYGGLAVYFEISWWIGLIVGIVFGSLIALYHKIYVGE